MNFQMQITADGAMVREFCAEISGTMAQRENQLHELCRQVESAVLEHSLQSDQPES